MQRNVYSIGKTTTKTPPITTIFLLNPVFIWFLYVPQVIFWPFLKSQKDDRLLYFIYQHDQDGLKVTRHKTYILWLRSVLIYTS